MEELKVSMESPKIQYGLMYQDKHLLSCRKTIEEDGLEWYRLDDVGEPWLLEDYEKVVMAKWASEDYYNSSYDEPVNPYHPLDLVVVKVVTIMTYTNNEPDDELELVNKKLKEQGYATINRKKYFGK
jgi:hypothetical protein